MRYALMTACVVGMLASSPAQADFSGLLGGGYGQGTGGADGYGIVGSLLMSSPSGRTNAQFNGGFLRTSLGGVSLDDTHGEGSLFLRTSRGALGLSLRYDHLTAGAASGPFTITASDNLMSYGLFGELYLGEQFTLFAKGGGFSGFASGPYGGVGAKWYIFDNIAVSGAYQYGEANSTGISAIGIGAQYLLSRAFPGALGVSYQYSEAGAGSNGSSVLATFTFRFGAPRASLSAWDRTGPAIWTGGMSL